MITIRTAALLIAAFSLTLGGCSSTPIGSEPPASVRPRISAGTWLEVDEEIWGVSRLAANASKAYARGAMDEWMQKVRQRTEAAFVPWYLDYWTQQWVSVKLAWYELGREEGDVPAAERLAAYLHEEYQSRVLQPVAQQVDPRLIRDEASAMYVQLMSEKIRGLANRHLIPPGEFHRRLEAIPAIDIAGDPGSSASLAGLVDGGRFTASPAYVALIRVLDGRGADVAGDDTSDELHPVARIAADKLADTVAVRGGAAAAAAVVGGPAGALISVGAFGWGAYEYERDKPELERRLRDSLDSALKDIWRYMAEDPNTGVTAPVHHMSTRIERGVSVPYAGSVRGMVP